MKKIIVIDSDKKFSTLLKSVCDPAKVDILFYTLGKEGVDEIADNTPDLVILSLEISDMNGFLVCNMLKKNSLTKKIPIIITSLEKSEKDFEQHKKLKLRAENYLKKPFSGDDLKIALKEILGNSFLKSGKSDAVDDFTEENIDKLLDSTFLHPENQEDENIVASDDSTEFNMVDSINNSLDKEEIEIEEIEEKEEQDSAVSLDFSQNFEVSDEFEVLPSESGQQDLILPEDSKVDSADLVLSTDEDDGIIMLDNEASEEEVIVEQNEPTTQKIVENIEEKIKEEPDNLTVELAELKNKTTELENVNKEKESVLSKIKENNQDLSAELLSLEKQNEFLKGENKNLLINIKSLQADIEERVTKSEGEVTAMKEQMEFALVEKEKISYKYNSLTEKHSNLQVQYDNNTSENQKLKQENAEFKEKVSMMETVLREKEELLMKKEEEKLHETEKMFEEFKAKEETLKIQVATLEKDRNDIQMQMLDKQKTLMDQVAELEKDNKEKTQQIVSLDNDNNTISEKLYNLESSYEKIKTEKVEKEKILLDSNANLTKNLMETEQKLNKFKAKFDNLMKVINEE